MPHATAKYPFEWEILSWAGHLSAVMTGEMRCFLLILDPDGTVRQLFFGEDEYNYDREMWGALKESNECWLFYHPFDGPAYTYINWQGIEQRTIERLIGKDFQETDFATPAFPHSPEAVGNRIEFPTFWGVMF
jgi:hypothetical protein